MDSPLLIIDQALVLPVLWFALQCYIEKGNLIAGIRSLRRAARIPVLGTDVGPRHAIIIRNIALCRYFIILLD
jgi:hypothetical protein